MSDPVRKKHQITATVPPYVKRRVTEIAEECPDFTSISDIVTYTLIKFITKHDLLKRNKIISLGDNIVPEHCRICGNKIEDGEMVYLLLQGKISEGCFVRNTDPLNALVCPDCLNTVKKG